MYLFFYVLGEFNNKMFSKWFGDIYMIVIEIGSFNLLS